jgi:hypothetical protein
MNGWSFDISQAPRDGSPVILAFAGKVIKSCWIIPKFDPPHWNMLSHRNEPVAWMPWPQYPGEDFQIAPASQGEAEAPSAERVNPHRSGDAVANAGGGDVNRSAPRAPVEAGTVPTSLAGGLESGIDLSFVDETASGPDGKRAPISMRSDAGLDIVVASNRASRPTSSAFAISSRATATSSCR